MIRTMIMIMGLASTLTLTARELSFNKRAAMGVIERVFPQMADRLRWGTLEKEGDGDVFSQEIQGNRLRVSASSEVAACRGVYDFIRQNSYGISSWTGNRLQLPENLEGSRVRKVCSPFAHHYYLNVVTYGYTMPYWDWNRWEKEIDWMALHGIDLPLVRGLRRLSSLDELRMLNS